CIRSEQIFDLLGRIDQAVSHLPTLMAGKQRLAVRQQRVTTIASHLALGTNVVDQVERAPQRFMNLSFRDREVVKLPLVVQTRKDEVKQDFAVGVSTHVGPQERWQHFQQFRSYLGKTGRRADLGEEPLSISERMGVVGA